MFIAISLGDQGICMCKYKVKHGLSVYKMAVEDSFGNSYIEVCDIDDILTDSLIIEYDKLKYALLFMIYNKDMFYNTIDSINLNRDGFGRYIGINRFDTSSLGQNYRENTELKTFGVFGERYKVETQRGLFIVKKLGTNILYYLANNKFFKGYLVVIRDVYRSEPDNLNDITLKLRILKDKYGSHYVDFRLYISKSDSGSVQFSINTTEYREVLIKSTMEDMCKEVVFCTGETDVYSEV